MRRVSSRVTYFYKRVFPVLWFGVLAIFLVSSFVIPSSASGGANTPPVPFFIVPIFMAAFGYFFMKKMIFDLVDEVFDAGNALVVKNRGREDRIAMADIKNVNYTPMMSPPRVTLSLRKPSVFGDNVTFCAPLQMIPLSNHPIIDDLIQRIDAAREGRGRAAHR